MVQEEQKPIKVTVTLRTTATSKSSPRSEDHITQVHFSDLHRMTYSSQDALEAHEAYVDEQIDEYISTRNIMEIMKFKEEHPDG